MRTEIWMYGLRNPWRFSFDRANGRRLDRRRRPERMGRDRLRSARPTRPAVNWGWNPLEGTHEFGGRRRARRRARDPIFELSHDDGNCSVTGGYVYRGQAIPALHGAYVFADYCVGELIALVQRDGALGRASTARRARRRSHVVRRGPERRAVRVVARGFALPDRSRVGVPRWPTCLVASLAWRRAA